MQNEDETNVPTGDELFEQPVELAGEADHALGTGASKTSAGTDAQRKRSAPSPKSSGGTDIQGRRS
jgi:hypothetical protein